MVWSAFSGEGGVSLTELTGGAVGRGTITIFAGLPDQGVPRLYVELAKEESNGPATARVFAVPEADPGVDAEHGGGDTGIREPASTPSIILEAPAGWWRRGAQTNYDLDITIYGGLYSIWSPKSWIDRVADDQRTVEIMVRDQDGDGVPDFDLRNLLVFPQDGYYHVNYAERQCEGPLEVDLGVVPEWPFIAAPRVGGDGQLLQAGRHEQRNGQLRPPIVVDWSTGRIEFFSELVTLRNHSCTYGLYSIRPMREGASNDLDFETPFAFYDLREARDGFPDLIIRSVYSPAHVSPWKRVTRDTLEGTRYSWRVDERANWDLHFDYKVELAGQHGYDAETPIADGLASISAPAWADLPSWLIERDWPFVTFVSTEGNQYRSNEGIYEWSTRAAGPGLLLGATAGDNVASAGAVDPVRYSEALFSTIRRGLRGEVRIGDASPALLYLSPLSNRLHLLGALHGVHELGTAGTLQSQNLVPDEYLDTWRLDASTGIQWLVHLPGWLVLESGNRMSFAVVDVPHSLGTVMPPTDHASWLAFRDQVTPITDAKRPASDLATWFDAHADTRTVIGDTTVADVWHQPGSVHLLIEVTANTGPIGIEGVPDLTPGRWVLTFDLEDRLWSTTPARPPALEAVIRSTEFMALTAQQIDMVVVNSGTIAARERASMSIDGIPVASWDQLTVPASDALTATINWVPPTPGTFPVTLEFAGERYALGNVEVAAPKRAGPIEAALLSLGPAALALVLVGMIAFFVAGRVVPRGDA